MSNNKAKAQNIDKQLLRNKKTSIIKNKEYLTELRKEQG